MTNPPVAADPSVIGRVAQAPFVRLPAPARVFAARAARFEHLAADSPLGPYLTFLAGIADAQARLVAVLPAPAPITAERRAEAKLHAMPPLDRARMTGDAGVEATLDAFFAAAAGIAKPPAAEAALERVTRADPASRAAMVGHLVEDAMPADQLAEHLFCAAGLQIAAAALAAGLDAAALVPVGTGLCPVCGGRPATSLVVGTAGAEGTRYAACAFCATLWNEVRIKCLACGSTKGIGYRAIDAGQDEATIKAEVCDECRSWIKILYQDKNPSLDPIADDVGSLGLDLMMQETAYRRAGFDPFLVGY